MSPRHPEFLLSRVKRTHRGFCGKQAATTRPNNRCLRGQGVEGERGQCQTGPRTSASSPGKAGGGGWSCHRGRGSSWPRRPGPEVPGAERWARAAAYGCGRHRGPPAVEAAPAARGNRSPGRTTLTLRRLGSRARPPQPPGRLPRPQRRKQPPALLAALLSCSHLCARAPPPLPPPPPKGGLALPPPPRFCRCRAVAGVDAAAGGGACGRGGDGGGRCLAPSLRGAAARRADAASRRPPGKPGAPGGFAGERFSSPVLHSRDVDGVPGPARHHSLTPEPPGRCTDFIPKLQMIKLKLAEVISRPPRGKW